MIVVIIGAGPAGLMIAKELSNARQDVLLVDIKKDIPVINRSCCTMLINEPNTHGDTATIVDNNIHFEKTGFYGALHRPVGQDEAKHPPVTRR